MSLFRRRVAGAPVRMSLGLSAHEAALVWGGATEGTPQQSRREHGGLEGLHVAAELVRGAFDGTQRARVPLRVTLSDDLVHWWLVSTSSGTASLRELERYAELRHDELFGHSLTGWRMRADWRASGWSVCCAVPEPAVQCVSSLKHQFGVVALDAVPASSRLSARWLQPGSAPTVLACVAGARAVVWWFGPRGVTRVRTVCVAAADPRPALDAELQRVASLASAGSEVAEGRAEAAVLLTAHCGADADVPHTKSRFEVYSADVPHDSAGSSDASVAAYLGWRGGQHALRASH